MKPDPDEVCRAFPWVKELWLFTPRDPPNAQTASLDLLVVSAIPPREVRPGQRKRLLAQLQEQSHLRVDLRLTTSEQLAKWLGRGGRFAVRFRDQAVKLFERSSEAS